MHHLFMWDIFWPQEAIYILDIWQNGARSLVTTPSCDYMATGSELNLALYSTQGFMTIQINMNLISSTQEYSIPSEMTIPND